MKKFLHMYIISLLIELFVGTISVNSQVSPHGDERNLVPLIQGTAFLPYGMKLSPDGRLCAMPLVAPGKGIGIWDVHSGYWLLTVPSHGEKVIFNQSGEAIAIIEPEMTEIWDLHTIKRIASLPVVAESAIFLSNSKLLLVSKSNIRLWDIVNPKQILDHAFPQNDVTTAEVNDNATSIFIGHNDGWITVLNSADLNTENRFRSGSKSITSLYASGGQLAVASSDGSIRLHRIISGDLINMIVIAQDGKETRTNVIIKQVWADSTINRIRAIVHTAKQELGLWEAWEWEGTSGKIKLQPKTIGFSDCSLSRNGKVVAGSFLTFVGFWDYDRGNIYPSISEVIRESGSSLDVSLDNERVLLVSGDKIFAWDSKRDLVTWLKLNTPEHAFARYCGDSVVATELKDTRHTESYLPADIFLSYLDVFDRQGKLVKEIMVKTSEKINSLGCLDDQSKKVFFSYGEEAGVWDTSLMDLITIVDPAEKLCSDIKLEPLSALMRCNCALTRVADTLQTLKDTSGNFNTFACDDKSEWIAGGTFGGDIILYSLLDGKTIKITSAKLPAYNEDNRINSLNFGKNGKSIISGDNKGNIRVWEVPAKRLISSFNIGERVFEMVSIPEKRLLLVSSLGKIHILSFEEKSQIISELATLLVVGGEKNDWLAYSPEGFFDGNSDSWRLVPFSTTDDRLQFFRQEQFFNQFYQPGLLADIFRKGKPIREILRDRGDPRAKLDVAKYRDSKLPEVCIIQPEDGSKTGEREIQVVVEARDMGSGLCDLRVFRNQTLVYFKHGELIPNAQTKKYLLPVKVKLVAGKNEITAYAFNRDNIKSKDATITVTGSETLKRMGTAYVLAVGIDKYSNPNKDWKIDLADKDAKEIAKTLYQSFVNLKTYEKVVPVVLVGREATKGNILTAFDLLSGKKTRASLTSRSPKDLKKLQLAKPEDDIIVYFSGHGMADQDRYYLVPHDLGYTGSIFDLGIDEKGRKTLKEHSLSDQNLNERFEKIDAGRMMLIIDACFSGKALESEEERRGPMNSRGLAQLAYEKGMYILAAAQKNEIAMGVLTDTLLEKGLKKSEAATSSQKQITAEDWLDYAVKNVRGQSPRAYYRRERVGDPWIIWRVEEAYPM